MEQDGEWGLASGRRTSCSSVFRRRSALGAVSSLATHQEEGEHEANGGTMPRTGTAVHAGSIRTGPSSLQAPSSLKGPMSAFSLQSSIRQQPSTLASMLGLGGPSTAERQITIEPEKPRGRLSSLANFAIPSMRDIDVHGQMHNAVVALREDFTPEEYDLIEEAVADNMESSLPPIEDIEPGREPSVLPIHVDLDELDKEIADLGTGPNSDFLAHLSYFIEKYKIRVPKVTVEYRNVNMSTQAHLRTHEAPTLTDTFLRLGKNLLFIKPKTTEHKILQNVSGVLKPGRLTLLLGPPGSGKSSFLKALSGRQEEGSNIPLFGARVKVPFIKSNVKFEGSIKYNGYKLDEFNVKRTAAYVAQQDVHIPQLTVMETMEFAHVCQHGFHPELFDLLQNIEDAMRRAGVRSGMADEVDRSDDSMEPQGAEGQRTKQGDSQQHDAPVPLGAPEHPGGTSLRLDLGPSEPGVQQAPPAAPSPDPAVSSSLTGPGFDDAQFLRLLQKLKRVRGFRTRVATRVLGLSHVRDRPVGDAIIPGISGGERRRLTIAEMYVGGKVVMFLDEIGAGLEFNTLYDIVQLLGRVTRGLKNTMVISLLQPAAEVFNSFDDVILMGGGHIVWHGPVNEVLPFFSQLRFVCPVRKNVSAFLQEVVTPAGQLEYATDGLLAKHGISDRSNVPDDKKNKMLLPHADMAAAYWNCPTGKEMRDQLRRPYDRWRCHIASLKRLDFEPLGWAGALYCVTKRQVILMTKNWDPVKIRLYQGIATGLVMGSLWYQIQKRIPSGGSSVAPTYLGAIYIIIMFCAFGTMKQTGIGMATRGVWYKHRDHEFYPAWAHTLAQTCVSIPFEAFDVIVWCIITYFMIGFYYGAGYFFAYFCVLFITQLAFGTLFRLVGHLAPDVVWANTIGGFIMLITVVSWHNGFTITRSLVPPWWIWAFWLCPYTWTVISLATNEFTSPQWYEPDTTNNNKPIGQTGLEVYDMVYDSKWVWYGVAFNIGQVLLGNLMSALALHYLTGAKRLTFRVSDEAMAAAQKQAKEKMKWSRQGQANQDVNMEIEKQSVIAFPKITLIWRELTYCVRQPRPDNPNFELELVKPNSGYAEPGTMTAFIGGDRAGAATLMNCIAGKGLGTVRGDIFVNGHYKEPSTWRHVMGYVELASSYRTTLNVMETLEFSGRLRLPDHICRPQIKDQVKQVIGLVGLEDKATTAIAYLSPEQLKRLSLANHLMTAASVIFMDEPTLGMVSRDAYMVMQAIQNVCDTGRTILCTVHQPLQEVFEAFDKVVMLQRGGKVVYFGDLGHHSSALLSYIQAVPGVPPCPDNVNSAKWALEATGGAVGINRTFKRLADELGWAQLYQESETCRIHANYAKTLLLRDKNQTEPVKAPALKFHGKYTKSFVDQSWILLDMFSRVFWRTPTYNYYRFLMTIIPALFYGSLYWQQCSLSNPTRFSIVQSVAGVIFVSVIFMGVDNMLAAITFMAQERAIFYKELTLNYYSAWPYGLIITLVEMPYQFLQMAIFVGILYPMLSFYKDPGHFFYFLLIGTLFMMFYVTMGVALLFTSPNEPLARFFAMGANFFFILFNGFAIAYPVFPVYWRWANRLAPTTWIIYGLVVDQLGNRQELVSGTAQDPPPTVGQFINQRFGYDYGFRFWIILILVSYIVFFRVCAILAMRYIRWR